jgi:hypothetical protein
MSTSILKILTLVCAGHANELHDHTLAESPTNLAKLGKHYASLNFSQLRPIANAHSMVTYRHMLLAYESILQFNRPTAYIAGDVVECGVWRGGNMFMMIMAQLHSLYQKHARHFWLFDTFEGLPEPTSEFDDTRAKKIYSDIASGSASANNTRFESGKAIDNKWNYGPQDVVKWNMAATGYPPSQIHLVRGKVEQSLYAQNIKLPDQIALLRLDTDWYDSTMAELDVLFRRLVPGGLLVIDDYCSWGGARTAVNHFFGNMSGGMKLLQRVSAVKPCLHIFKKSA